MANIKPVEWTDEMSVGVNVIDEDHKKLLALLNEMEFIIDANVVSNSGAIESVLSELLDYTVYHFDREEILMKACDYPDLLMHQQVHATLIGQVQQLVDKHRQKPHSFDPKALRTFLEYWLLDHILGMDKEYESWMSGKDDIIDKTNKEFEHRS